jgi:hypothetical protein
MPENIRALPVPSNPSDLIDHRRHQMTMLDRIMQIIPVMVAHDEFRALISSTDHEEAVTGNTRGDDWLAAQFLQKNCSDEVVRAARLSVVKRWMLTGLHYFHISRDARLAEAQARAAATAASTTVEGDDD